jgi:hypothetical protein
MYVLGYSPSSVNLKMHGISDAGSFCHQEPNQYGLGLAFSSFQKSVYL